MDWKKLQNGSDIRGIAMEGVEGEKVNLTSDVASRLGRAFAIWLEKRGIENAKIAIGMDSRLTGEALKDAFSVGLMQEGANALDCGIASTPAMFMSTIMDPPRADAGVMLTASHLPFNRNGFKFFTVEGGLDKTDITDILEIASGDIRETSAEAGSTNNIELLSDYASFLVEFIRKGVNDPSDYDHPLKGLKIIVDAGNGSGGFFADRVLAALGANTRGSQFLDPDGTFPNHIPNPENHEAMNSICEAVIKEKADLGIIFDTDVDRAAIVDAMGSPVNRNELIALISAIVLKEHPGSIVVTDSITSDGLSRFISQELKGIHHRFKRGYKNVINESVRLNKEGQESWLAIETSGHAALRENHFLDDGAYLVAKILVKMALLNKTGKNLTSLIEKLSKPRENREFRLSILSSDFIKDGQEVLAGLAESIKLQTDWVIVEPNYEGIRVSCRNEAEKGWFLLRMSLHDPVMPLNIESDSEGGILKIASRLREILNDYNCLDMSALST